MDSPVAQVAGILADASTTNPATGTWRYYNHDNLGSTRRLRASDKSSLGAYEYTPYGQSYATSGVALGSLAGAFTGKAWDGTAELYYFPYRYYSPAAARWLTRDPLGMVDGPNVYAYVKGNPVRYQDLDGRLAGIAAIIALLIAVGAAVFLVNAYQCAVAVRDAIKKKMAIMKHLRDTLDLTTPEGMALYQRWQVQLMNSNEFRKAKQECGECITGWLTGVTLNGTEVIPDPVPSEQR